MTLHIALEIDATSTSLEIKEVIRYLDRLSM